MRDGLKPVRRGLCVGGPLDGQIRSTDWLNIAFETLVVAEAEVGRPTWIELLDPLAAMQMQFAANRVRYVWRCGKWVYEPTTA
jgi:hypothetical protein